MTSVLVISKHSLFGRGVERLLCREAGLAVSSIDSDEPDALSRIAELKPDVVILDSSDTGCDPGPVLTQILRTKERTMIIGLDLSDNVACVCSIEHRLVKNVSDLLALAGLAVYD